MLGSGTHREEIRDLPGATASGAPVTHQEAWVRTVPPNGAQPKWNRPGQPIQVIEEPRGPGAEATGGMDGLEKKEGGMRAPKCEHFVFISGESWGPLGRTHGLQRP